MKKLRGVLVCLLGGLLGCGSVLANEGFECNQTDSTESCCLKKNPGQYERCGIRAPPQSSQQQMLGAKGPKFFSKTLYEEFAKALAKALTYLGETP